MQIQNFKPHRLSQTLQAVMSSSLLMMTSSHLYAVEVDAAAVKQLETIHVYATDDQQNYGSKRVEIAGFGSKDITKVPASITAVTSDLIADQQAKVLTEVIKNDASVGDGYAAVGYYPNIVSRGFALDLASSYLLNGQAIRGEQNIALENKERVEILKGVSAIQSGMSTPGGVVNYVTKRPKDIRAININADSNAGISLALDLGGFVGQEQQLGYRINAAVEDIQSYVEHANGKRYFGSLALDWNINEQSQLQFDLESQYQRQRSAPGYQLLDGKVPAINDLVWDRLLGYQSWSRLVSTHALNSSLKYQYAFNADWTASVSASHSKVVIDDYTAFPWGCYSDVCQYTGLGNSFDQNGYYDIYDYRNPDDTRETNQFKAALNGSFNTGSVLHHLMLDLTQTDKQRKRYDGVNELIGTGNIYQDTVDYAPVSASNGEFYQSLKSKQIALTVLDRLEFNPQWSVLLGGKWLHLNEKAYDVGHIETRNIDIDKFLPQAALMYSPWQDTNVYVSYVKGLTDGGTAPWYAENADQVLAPVNSIQYEIGIKQQIHNYLLTMALFDIRQDNQYTRPEADGSLTFIAEGKQHNQGVELALNGELTDRLKLNSSLAYIRSRLVDIDTAQYKDHQTQNVPKVRFTTYLSYDVPQLEGLRVLGGVQYSSSKFANKEATAKVGGYSVFDLGAAYNFQPYGYDTTLRINIENVLNKKYWRDVGGFMGDDYLFLGAPRTAKFSLAFNF